LVGVYGLFAGVRHLGMGVRSCLCGGGTEIDTQDMYFRDIRRCNFFVSEIEQGNRYRNGTYYYVGKRIDGWCVPVMVPSNTLFWD
jgi:hypothetical protein